MCQVSQTFTRKGGRSQRLQWDDDDRSRSRSRSRSGIVRGADVVETSETGDGALSDWAWGFISSIQARNAAQRGLNDQYKLLRKLGADEASVTKP